MRGSDHLQRILASASVTLSPQAGVEEKKAIGGIGFLLNDTGDSPLPQRGWAVDPQESPRI
jgi:hypothetical protein